MSIEVEVKTSVDAFDEDEYRSFHRASRASFFYDLRFLRAAEHSPLLPYEAAYYLFGRENGQLVSFMPAYRQSIHAVDPFGLLSRTAGIEGGGNQQALFSHVMHCFDSDVVGMPGQLVAPEMIAALTRLASDIGVQYFGLLNVAQEDRLTQLSAQQLQVRHLVDRYFLDLAGLEGFDALVQGLPKDGRYEMNRQLRKFEASAGQVSIVEPPFDQRLEALTRLCQQTTARNGTPQYFPADALARFVRICGGLMRLVLVEEQGEVAGGLICFLDGPVMCIWSAGMRYDLTAYSPYTVSFAHAYKWALASGVRTVEAGRLNARIKERLGLKPLPLFSATRAVVAW